MGKGINLEEFKNQLETDAQKRCAAQEKTIENLINQNKRFSNVIKDQEVVIGQLENRCWSITRGVMCLFCGFKNKCKAKK